MAFSGEWLRRGYFDFSADGGRNTPTQVIRDHLATSRGLPSSALRIASYPVGPAWRHTFWWREGTSDYSEAQVFAEIGHYPVLSLGVSIEKGREDAAAPANRRMVRSDWDWSILRQQVDLVLTDDVPASAASLQAPVHLRIRVRPQRDSNEKAEDRSFSFVDNHWYERRRGSATSEAIAEYVRRIDTLADCWVILHIAVDLDPTSVEGMTAEEVAGLLIRFEPVRVRLRGTPSVP